MAKPIDTPEYWIESYGPSGWEFDRLYEHVLEAGHPFDIESLAKELVHNHVAKAMETRRSSEQSDGTLYRPSERFKVGQKLVFPAMAGAEGVVETVRSGNNDAYGKYDVIAVKMKGGTREFAMSLQLEHALSQALAEVEPDEVAERFATLVAPQLASALGGDEDWIQFGDRWILSALLPEIHAGHCNLAEAILMLGGEPLPAEQIVPELELGDSVPAETGAMALEIALTEDERFRNVGALESPLWTLASQS